MCTGAACGLRTCSRRSAERFDADDRRFLALRRRGRPRGWRGRIPQGRFNAAEKSHAIVQAALAVLFAVSGVLLWLGERDTTFRLPGTVALHDAAMYVAIVLVLGHLYLALITARPARPCEGSSRARSTPPGRGSTTESGTRGRSDRRRRRPGGVRPRLRSSRRR